MIKKNHRNSSKTKNKQKETMDSEKAKKMEKSDNESENLDLGFMGSREDRADARTLSSRQRLHQKIDNEVDRFLANGGEINKVDPHVTADPPRRPTSNYGHRPI